MRAIGLPQDSRSTKANIIQSLQRGLSILEIIGKNGAALSMAGVSRAIGLHPSTTYHLLRTLTTLGYLRQDEATRNYVIGPKLFQVAGSAWTEDQLIKISAPFLAELAHQSGETSHLATFEHGDVIVVDRVEGSGPVHVSERIGYPRPAHCTAIGKTLLAYLPESELKSFLQTYELKAITARSITSIPMLEQELKRVREQAYAFDDEEFNQGIRCLAAPVRNFTGEVVASIGISGPVWRVSLDRVSRFIEIVKGTAHRLSQQLGYAAKTEGDGDPPPRP
jgi:DNA-binding IclR family transcriptional regulator